MNSPSSSGSRISKVALLVCYALMFFTGFFFQPRWENKNTEATLSWDVSGYYLYLPALFIYDDVKQLGFASDILARYQPTPNLQQAFQHPESGTYVMKYPAGMAVVMAPFFLAGHAIAKASASYPADGFSLPYQACIGIGMFLYALAGLYFLRRVLLLYFADKTVALVLLGLVFGTNYLSFSSINQAMPHNALFTIYALLLYVTIRFYDRPAMGKALGIGLLTGLAALIRPTDAIAILLPLAWGISSLPDLKNRVSFIFRNLRYYAAAILVFAAVGSVQLVYWKLTTGHWLVYSYQEQGFSWLHPHVLDFTLDYRTGWLRYSPLMVFAFVGLLPFFFKGKNLLAVITFFLLNFYLVTAWDVWDYGGTGGRAMVQSYPVLAFPLAALIEFVNRRKWLAIPFYALFALLAYVNIWWTFNKHLGGVQQLVSKRYYWHVLGKWKVDEFDTKLLENDYSYRGYPKDYRLVYENNLDADTSANSFIETGADKALFLDAGNQFTKEFLLPRPAENNDWFRISADLHMHQTEWDTWKQPQFVYKFYNRDAVIQQGMIRVTRYLQEGKTINVFLDAKAPEADWDRIGIFFWNADSDKKIVIDNLKVISFKE